MRMRDAIPVFYAEVGAALGVMGRIELLAQLPDLEITDRCACDEAGCATFQVAPVRPLNRVEENVIGVRHGESTPLDSVNGLVVIDTDNFGRISGIEVLYRQDVAVAVALDRLRIPRAGGRTRG